ncbi:hypothetical protein F5Y15DRAFT_427481 [Xylariaceae sp. FL0016]|nr:hypothetical protein F5Y15DRAFT_427481 [Xylariaceae sp. FL0016]
MGNTQSTLRDPRIPGYANPGSPGPGLTSEQATGGAAPSASASAGGGTGGKEDASANGPPNPYIDLLKMPDQRDNPFFAPTEREQAYPYDMSIQVGDHTLDCRSPILRRTFRQMDDAINKIPGFLELDFGPGYPVLPLPNMPRVPLSIPLIQLGLKLGDPQAPTFPLEQAFEVSYLAFTQLYIFAVYTSAPKLIADMRARIPDRSRDIRNVGMSPATFHAAAAPSDENQRQIKAHIRWDLEHLVLAIQLERRQRTVFDAKVAHARRYPGPGKTLFGLLIEAGADLYPYLFGLPAFVEYARTTVGAIYLQQVLTLLMVRQSQELQRLDAPEQPARPDLRTRARANRGRSSRRGRVGQVRGGASTDSLGNEKLSDGSDVSTIRG